MTKAELQAIEGIIARLKKQNCGCHNAIGTEGLVKLANFLDMEVVSRIYLNTWVIPALELLLPGEKRNPTLAAKLAK